MTSPKSDPPIAWNRTIPRSRLFDALSLILPAGESFVIATIEEWLRVASGSASDALRAEVGRLVREECAHQRAHDRYNAELIQATPGAASSADRAMRITDEISKLNLEMRLALVVAFERLTVVLSREVLTHPHLLSDHDCTQTRMWRWHAREEIAHGHVAAQVAAQHGVGRPRIALALGLAATFLLLDVLRCWLALCRCDLNRGFSRWRLMRDTTAFLVQSMPSFGRMAFAVWCHLVRKPSVTLNRPGF
jgi:predicted metal-dependent hydrolase